MEKEKEGLENNERAFAPYAKILRRSLENSIWASSDTAQELNIEEVKVVLVSEIRTIFLDGDPYIEGESRKAFEGFLSKLSAEQFNADNQDELMNLIIERTVKYLSSVFDVKDFESLLQEEFIKETAFPDRLNRTLAYEVMQNEVEIHVLPVILSNPLELRSLVIDGFKLLAQKIKTEDNFQRVEKITASLWIIKEHPRFVESLGFTIYPIKDISAYAHAEKSKEKFLELYS